MPGTRSVHAGAPRRKPTLPSESAERWRRTYAETPYRELPWFSPRAYRWLRTMVAEGRLRRGSRVIDLGCGAGTNALYLARSGFRVSGVDIAPGAIDAATRRAQRAGVVVDLRVGDVLRLPYASGEFAAATDVGCFHTLPEPLRPAYSAEVSRVLRPGGSLLLSWVAREHTGPHGPPHRLSLAEVTSVLEPNFLFRSVEYSDPPRRGLRAYQAQLERRRTLQPPPFGSGWVAFADRSHR